MNLFKINGRLLELLLLNALKENKACWQIVLRREIERKCHTLDNSD